MISEGGPPPAPEPLSSADAVNAPHLPPVPPPGSLFRSDFVGKVARTLVAEGALLALGLVSSIATARWLGPAGKGEFALLTVVVYLVYVFCHFGVSPSVVYFTKRMPQSHLIGSALSLSVALGFVSLVVGGGVTYFGLSGVLEVDRTALLIALLALPLLSVQSTARAVIQGNYELNAFNVLRILDTAVFLVLLAGLLFVPDRLDGAILAWTLAQVVSALVSVVVVLRGKGVRFERWQPTWARWKSLLAFGSRVHFGNTLKIFQYRFDVVLIGALLDKRQVGFYVVGLALAELPLRVPDAVGLVLFPKLAATEHEGSGPPITPVVCRHTVFITLASSVALFAAAPLAIEILFGSRFSQATVAARWLLPGGIALSVWKILAQAMMAKGRPTAYSFSALCSLAVMVVGCGVLVPWLGLTGGAIASSLAYVTAAVVLFVSYRRLTGHRLRDCVIMKRDDFELYRNALRKREAQQTAR